MFKQPLLRYTEGKTRNTQIRRVTFEKNTVFSLWITDIRSRYVRNLFAFLTYNGLLLADFWLRSSDTYYQRLVQSENYQKYIEKPLVQKQLSTKGMVRMFAMMLVVFAIPALLIPNLLVRFVLAAIYLAHVIGITWYLKGRKPAIQKTDQPL